MGRRVVGVGRWRSLTKLRDVLQISIKFITAISASAHVQLLIHVDVSAYFVSMFTRKVIRLSIIVVALIGTVV